jgi:hypothetical protein
MTDAGIRKPSELASAALACLLVLHEAGARWPTAERLLFVATQPIEAS